MNIAIIGSGNVGTALGKGWMKAGHSVTYGVRNPSSPKANKLSGVIPSATVQSIQDATKNADVIVITTPAETILELIPQLGSLENKLIIDATNTVRIKPEPYATAFHALKALTKPEALVKCFNTTGFENMSDPVYDDTALDMFCAGESHQGKQTTIKLAKDLGFENCYDFGGDDKVELLEKFAQCWINLAMFQGMGRNFAFKIISR